MLRIILRGFPSWHYKISTIIRNNNIISIDKKPLLKVRQIYSKVSSRYLAAFFSPSKSVTDRPMKKWKFSHRVVRRTTVFFDGKGRVSFSRSLIKLACLLLDYFDSSLLRCRWVSFFHRQFECILVIINFQVSVTFVTFLNPYSSSSCQQGITKT